jgi:hypothetical protein
MNLWFELCPYINLAPIALTPSLLCILMCSSFQLEKLLHNLVVSIHGALECTQGLQALYNTSYKKQLTLIPWGKPFRGVQISLV